MTMALVFAGVAGARDFVAADGNVAAAAEAAAKAGGGRVVVPAGIWTNGTIWLRSNVELHLEKGARIVGSLNRADYNADDVVPENWSNEGEEWSGGHLVFAFCATNVAVTGEGTIDGSGPKFFGDCDEVGRFPCYKYGLKLKPLDREWFRPGFMLCFLRCRDVRVSDVVLKDTPCWTAHFRCCDGVTVERVTVDADRTIANSDGISFDCTRNAVLRDSTLKTGDDSVTIRASCRVHAATNACENVTVENCDLWSCCYGVRIGVGTGTISNVLIRNCRVHESGAGFMLNPAFARKAKNVYISGVRIENCTVRESCRPLDAATLGGDRVRDVTVRDCDFEALQPCHVAGKPDSIVENVRFECCRHRYLPRFKVRYDLRWDRQTGARSHEFLETNEFCRAVETVDCLPRPAGASGVLLLTFDDRNFKGWESALPLFAKYGAHATFFTSGPIDNEAVKVLKKLSGAGHSIGLHGLRHRNADESIAKRGADRYYWEEIVPQQDAIKWAYIPCTSFAYPNCRRSDESDALFYRNGFLRVRGGVKGATPFDPKGEKQADRKPLVTNEAVFFPADELPRRRRLDTIIMGEAYHTDIDEILACVRRVAERKEVLTITSHNIAPNAKGISMKLEWLEKILALAQELALPVLGFDELPPVTK